MGVEKCRDKRLVEEQSQKKITCVVIFKVNI